MDILIYFIGILQGPELFTGFNLFIHDYWIKKKRSHFI